MRRDARTALAVEHLHGALEELRDATVTMLNSSDRDAYDRPLVRALHEFEKAFSTIAGQSCRACIKVLEASAEAPAALNADGHTRYFDVSTLLRSDGTWTLAKDGPSPLMQNSDFMQIWSPESTQRWFFSNDLDAEPGYQNPHRAGQDPLQFDYNATIVWPIQRAKPRGQATARFGLLGFLCVDTKAKGSFRQAPDFDLGAGFADSLYLPVALYQDLIEAGTATDGD